MYFREWQPRQWFAKLRAPRCSWSRFAISRSACHIFQLVWVAPSAPLSASAANRVPDVTSNVPHNNVFSARIELMRMVGHPRWLRLRRPHSRIDRHQNEEQEVQNRKNTCERDVQTLSRLQAQIAE